VKLFQKYFNLRDLVPERTSQTDRQTTCCRVTALCVASRGKNNDYCDKILKFCGPNYDCCDYTLSAWTL